MTTCSYEKWLTEKLKLNEKITNELAYGLISNNYCQDQTVHAFVGKLMFGSSRGSVPFKVVDILLLRFGMHIFALCISNLTCHS